MRILSPETDSCLSWISGRERMTVENIWWSISTKECCQPGGDQTHNLLIISRMYIRLSYRDQPLAIQNVPSKDSDQTAWMCRLIWIFTGPICPNVHFQTLWLKCNCIFQINSLTRDMKKESQFDKVFTKCLQSFHRELKSTLSVHLQVNT